MGSCEQKLAKMIRNSGVGGCWSKQTLKNSSEVFKKLIEKPMAVFTIKNKKAQNQCPVI
jgi:hypothetical protein